MFHVTPGAAFSTMTYERQVGFKVRKDSPHGEENDNIGLKVCLPSACEYIFVLTYA